MKVRFVTAKGKVLARRSDLTAIPQVGQLVILADDKDYEVVSVSWDLINSLESHAVIELKNQPQQGEEAAE